MANLETIYEAILTGNLEKATTSTQQAIDENTDPQTIVNESMTKAMEEVGRRFEAGKAFVPQLLLAARAMKGALELLKPLLKGGASEQCGTVVIGTVKGDLHDIGKNLVASMLEGCGFKVVNLGVDVAPATFVSAVKEHNADIVCLSALLTTTMENMKEVIDTLRREESHPNLRIMVGGAPVSRSFAEQIGADGYSSNANAAVTLAKSFVA